MKFSILKIPIYLFSFVEAISMILIWLFSMPVFLFFWLFGLVFGRCAKDYLLRIYVKYASKFMIFATCSSVKIYGMENIPRDRSNILYIANHQSYFDIIIIYGFIDRYARFIAREDLFHVPMLGLWMKALGAISISRSISRDEIKKFSYIAEELKNGAVMVMFPEGTRSLNGSLGQFYTSSFRSGRKACSKMIPMRIWNSKRILPRGSYLIRPAKVKIVIGEVIDPKDYEKAKSSEFAEMIREIMLNLKINE